ncbi:DNA glycosylase [Tricholoma matsutake]|nr:DNA glycosylase [Tricholoma matsutake 945]
MFLLWKAKNASTRLPQRNDLFYQLTLLNSLSQNGSDLVPAVLTFSFEDAKQHLAGVDHRFDDLFNRMECKPFQHLERVHPFRALVTSILGQQISWLAARSINHRFIRLFDPSLPEKPTDYEAHRSPASFFPTAEQVASTDIAVLRTAGLSVRKAEYVHDLASRFADGRLSTENLIHANDEELAQMLIEVRGIGRWTIDMFAIFSLRRPNILPVGDLGVQRGLIRWFLSLHSPSYNFGVSPKKLAGQSSGKQTEKSNAPTTSIQDLDELPLFGTQAGSSSKESPADVDDGLSEPEESTVASIPPPFTPSIKTTLNKPAVKPGMNPISLPDGLSVAVLKSRLDGKKKIKGALLTPKEMEDLTESWKPYRSIGVYYMWSLAEVTE